MIDKIMIIYQLFLVIQDLIIYYFKIVLSNCYLIKFVHIKLSKILQC